MSTTTTAAPEYEFDVYRLEPMCKEGGSSGMGGELLGDVLIVFAQVSR